MSRLIEAVRAGDTARVEAMVQARPEIINMDAAANGEQQAMNTPLNARSRWIRLPPASAARDALRMLRIRIVSSV